MRARELRRESEKNIISERLCERDILRERKELLGDNERGRYQERGRESERKKLRYR